MKRLQFTARASPEQTPSRSSARRLGSLPRLFWGATQRLSQRILRGARATPGLARALPAGRPWFATRMRLLLPDVRDRLMRRSLAQRIMEHQHDHANHPIPTSATSQSGGSDRASVEPEIAPDGAPSQGIAQADLAAEAQQAGQPAFTPPRMRHVLLVRHGQSQYNVEGRLPGQLPGVSLTDEGRRQAHHAAVALSGLPLSAVITSPLERARDTAEIIARGWALPVREDARLMDTNVGRWAGLKIDEVAKSDPAWKAFVEHPTEPPPGIESLAAVQARAVDAVTDALDDPTTGDYLVFVAHADVIKLIVMRYTNVAVDGVRFLSISNASISALAFAEFPAPEGNANQDGATATKMATGVVRGNPTVLAVNWTSAPRWLVAPKPKSADAQTSQANSTDNSNNATKSGGDTEGYLAAEALPREHDRQ
ncbi:MAG TPA: histidine phosphatase family protein [Ktedonobacterales bacterium]|nr:histidine phosphatase family protein [Ktedonobacterales bacterium]